MRSTQGLWLDEKSGSRKKERSSCYESFHWPRGCDIYRKKVFSKTGPWMGLPLPTRWQLSDAELQTFLILPDLHQSHCPRAISAGPLDRSIGPYVKLGCLRQHNSPVADFGAAAFACAASTAPRPIIEAAKKARAARRDWGWASSEAAARMIVCLREALGIGAACTEEFHIRWRIS